MAQLSNQLHSPDVWEDPKRTVVLQRGLSISKSKVEAFSEVDHKCQELKELADFLQEEQDQALLDNLIADYYELSKRVDQLEFRRMFSQAFDAHNAFVEIQAGSGGTEAQDWAEMLYRMYVRWIDSKGFKYELLDWSPGDVAGIKGATLRVVGEYVFGWLRTETGIHRLVRKSPFDSGNRRHTSFASIHVTPEIDDSVDVMISPTDLRIDTYRSSGAGGQHVNTTDSAVRITHMPTQIVVQCQSERSQHQNKARAMLQLRAKLYQYELQKRAEVAKANAAIKDDISWGNQIRSYVLDQSRVKDLRTGHESGNPQAVLDGGLDEFIELSLKKGVGSPAYRNTPGG